jgi:hypothetical protein
VIKHKEFTNKITARAEETISGVTANAKPQITDSRAKVEIVNHLAEKSKSGEIVNSFNNKLEDEKAFNPSNVERAWIEMEAHKASEPNKELSGNMNSRDADGNSVSSTAYSREMDRLSGNLDEATKSATKAELDRFQELKQELTGKAEQAAEVAAAENGPAPTSKAAARIAQAASQTVDIKGQSASARGTTNSATSSTPAASDSNTKSAHTTPEPNTVSADKESTAGGKGDAKERSAKVGGGFRPDTAWGATGPRETVAVKPFAPDLAGKGDNISQEGTANATPKEAGGSEKTPETQADWSKEYAEARKEAAEAKSFTTAFAGKGEHSFQQATPYIEPAVNMSPDGPGVGANYEAPEAEQRMDTPGESKDAGDPAVAVDPVELSADKVPDSPDTTVTPDTPDIDSSSTVAPPDNAGILNLNSAFAKVTGSGKSDLGPKDVVEFNNFQAAIEKMNGNSAEAPESKIEHSNTVSVFNGGSNIDPQKENSFIVGAFQSKGSDGSSVSEKFSNLFAGMTTNTGPSNPGATPTLNDPGMER